MPTGQRDMEESETEIKCGKQVDEVKTRRKIVKKRRKEKECLQLNYTMTMSFDGCMLVMSPRYIVNRIAFISIAISFVTFSHRQQVMIKIYFV